MTSRPNVIKLKNQLCDIRENQSDLTEIWKLPKQLYEHSGYFKQGTRQNRG